MNTTYRTVKPIIAALALLLTWSIDMEGRVAQAVAQSAEIDLVMGEQPLASSFSNGRARETYSCSQTTAATQINLDAVSEIKVTIRTFDNNLLAIQPGVTIYTVAYWDCRGSNTTHPLNANMILEDGAPAFTSATGRTSTTSTYINYFEMNSVTEPLPGIWDFRGLEMRLASWRSGTLNLLSHPCYCIVRFEQNTAVDTRPLAPLAIGYQRLLDVTDDDGTECGAAGGVLLHTGLDNGRGGGVVMDNVLQPGERRESRAICNGTDGTSCTVEPQEAGATIVCSDGSTQFIENGVDGRDGIEGTDGADGSSCSVEENADGSATITCDDGSTADFDPAEDGTSCTVEENADGSARVSCEDGSEVTIEPGASGPQGPAGADGNTDLCTVVESPDGAEITCPDGSSVFVANGAGGGCSVGTSPKPSGFGLSLMLLGLMALYTRRRISDQARQNAVFLPTRNTSKGGSQ